MQPAYEEPLDLCIGRLRMPATKVLPHDGLCGLIQIESDAHPGHDGGVFDGLHAPILPRRGAFRPPQSHVRRPEPVPAMILSGSSQVPSAPATRCARSQVASSSSEQRRSATASMVVTTSASGASTSQPLRPRKTSIARKAMRLFPSR